MQQPRSALASRPLPPTAAPKSTERHPGDPAAALTKPSEASARARRRSRGWAFTRSTATWGFTFLLAWRWKAAGAAQSGSLPSPRCTWYSGPALQGDTAGGCSQGERTPLLPARRCSSGPAGSPGSEGLERRGRLRGLVLPPAGAERGGTPRSGAAPAPRCPQTPLTSLVHGPDPDGNFHLGVRHLPRSRERRAGGPAQRRRRQRHGGAPASMPGRARGRRAGAGGEGDRGRERGREGEEEEGPAPGRAVVAQPQPPPCSAAVRAGAGCRRARLQNRCRRRLPANPHRHLPPPPPPAAPTGVRAPRQAARGRGKAAAPERDGNTRAPSARRGGEIPSPPAPSSARRWFPGSRRGGTCIAREGGAGGSGCAAGAACTRGPCPTAPSCLLQVCAATAETPAFPSVHPVSLGQGKEKPQSATEKNVMVSGDGFLTNYARRRMTWVQRAWRPGRGAAPRGDGARSPARAPACRSPPWLRRAGYLRSTRATGAVLLSQAATSASPNAAGQGSGQFSIEGKRYEQWCFIQQLGVRRMAELPVGKPRKILS